MTNNQETVGSPNQFHLGVPWTKRDVLWAIALGTFMLLGLLALMILGVQLYQLATGAESRPGVFGVFVLAAESGLLLPVWLLGVHKYRLPWSSVGFRQFDPSRALGLGCLYLLSALAFNFSWSIFLAFFGLRAQPDVLPLFGGGIAGLLLALLVGGLVAPIAEEVFFRGYIFTGLRRDMGFRPAVMLSAMLFALAHVLPTSWPPIFFLGILFALLYEQTRSIWPAVIVHGVINTLAFLASYLLQLMRV